MLNVEGKTGEPGEKPLGAEQRTNNKLNPNMTLGPGIEPLEELRWSGLTTRKAKHEATGMFKISATEAPSY